VDISPLDLFEYLSFTSKGVFMILMWQPASHWETSLNTCCLPFQTVPNIRLCFGFILCDRVALFILHHFETVTNGFEQTQQKCFGSLVDYLPLYFLCFGNIKSCTTSLAKLRKIHFQI